MKSFWKVLLLLTLVTVLSLCLFACGESGSGSETPEPPKPVPDENVNLKTIYTTNVTFKDKVVTYTGENFTHEDYSGKPDPNRVSVSYEYWQNGAKVAGEEGVSAPGIYDVKLIFSKEGYKDAVVTAKLTVAIALEVNYEVGLPTDLPEGAQMDIGENPTGFSAADTGNKALELSGATLEGYKFKGWYTNPACTPESLVTVIDGSLYSTNLTLYAKFQKYLAYPTAYEYSTTVTEAPTVLPAIPGYEEVTKDSFKIVDMSLLTGDIYPDNMTIKYTHVTKTEADQYYYCPLREPIQTANGAYALNWFDYNDTADFVGEDYTAVAGDTYGCTILDCSKTIQGFDWGSYDTVEFWLYCANSTVTTDNPEGSVISLWMWCQNDNTKALRTNITLDFSGWKKFSLDVSDFNNPAGANMNTTRFTLYATPQGNLGEGANLYENKAPNFIYLSDVFLTNRNSAYPATTSMSNTAVISLLENLAAQPNRVVAAEAATNAASILNTLAAGEWDATDMATLATAVYQAAHGLGMGENGAFCQAADSLGYQPDEIREMIGVGINELSYVLNDMADSGEYTLANTPALKNVCLYLVEAAILVGDFTNEVHGMTWTHGVLTYFPSALGDGSDAIQSAYIYTCASILLRDTQGTLAGIRQMVSVLSEKKISLATQRGETDISMVTRVLAAAKGTDFAPNSAAYRKFISELFDWFYTDVDAVLQNGVVPLTLSDNLAEFIYTMLFVYDQADASEQAKFAAAVKSYLAANAGLQAELEALAEVYAVSEDALTAVLANSATAQAPQTSVAIQNDKIGTSIYKNDNYYFLLTQSGTMVVSGTTVNLTPMAYEKYYGLVAENTLAILADGTAIVATQSGVTVNEGDVTVVTEGNVTVYVLTNAAAGTVVSSTGMLNESSRACILVVKDNGDNTFTCTMYNYTHSKGDATNNEIILALNGYYRLTDTNPAIRCESSEEISEVSLKVAGDGALKGYVYTFTLRYYPM